MSIKDFATSSYEGYDLWNNYDTEQELIQAEKSLKDSGFKTKSREGNTRAGKKVWKLYYRA